MGECTAARLMDLPAGAGRVHLLASPILALHPAAAGGDVGSPAAARTLAREGARLLRRSPPGRKS